MKTFALILLILGAQLYAQEKQQQNTEPPETSAQFTSAQTSQTEAPPATKQPKIFIEPAAKPAQPPFPQQLITFTTEQLVEHDNKILDRAETFYNNRMTYLLWTMGILIGIGAIIVPLVVNGLIQYQRKISFTKELVAQSLKFEKALADDSAIHFLEHAKGLLYDESFVIDKFSLLLLSAKRFAEAENINGIYRGFEFIKALQMPRYSLGRDIKSQYDMLLSRYDMVCIAIRKSGFEKEFATQLESIKKKIEDWYKALPENRGPN